MKRRITIGILLLGLVLIAATACGGNDKGLTGRQPAKSDINATVTADGTVEALLRMGLTFGSGGKVDNIYVKEGDEVSKGDVLAKLDTGALELALTRAKFAQAEAQLAISQAEVTLQTAELNLEQTQDLYAWSDILAAKADVDNTQRDLDELLEIVGKFLPEERGRYPTIQEYVFGEDFPKNVAYETWQKQLVHAQARLNTAKDRLRAMLSGTDPKEVAIKKLQVETTKRSLELAKQSLELAEQSVRQAQKQLDEATITAPFDGTVSKIGAKEGEFLSSAAFTGTTVVEIIDLRQMKLTARVDETDIAKVKTGQKVIISVDALPGAKLEGRVTFISPVAREPRVVLFEDEDEEKQYEVKIDFALPENSPIRSGMSATAEIFVK